MPNQFSRRPDAVVGARRANSAHRNDGEGVDMNVRNHSLALFAAAISLATPALAEEVKRVGVIMSMSDGQLSLRTREGMLTVVLTPTTSIEEIKGLSNKDRATDSLMTGLIIK